MKKQALLLFLIFVSTLVHSQTVTLGIHQAESLQIKAPITEYKILEGSMITLGSDIIATGGSGQYETIWSCQDWQVDSIRKTITVHPSETTTYSLKVVDKNGCFEQQQFHVNVISILQVNFTTIPSCFGKSNGFARLQINGGEGPYQIAWSNGKTTDVITNLLPGNYTATVTDKMNQKQIKTLTIKENPQIKNVLDIFICEGNSYKFAGTDLKTTGVFKNTFMTNAGCDSIVTVYLTVNSIPEIPRITQNGDILQSSSVEGNQWFKDGLEVKGENKQTLLISTSGNYKVSVTNTSGCAKESSVINVLKTDVPVIQADDFTCKVFPNPNKGIFTIEIESSQTKVFDLELLTSEGKSIIKQTVEHLSGKQSLPFGKTSLADGIYYLQIKYGLKVLSRQIIVN
ncbi:MAG: T9SS type A sorting domain-containing protein [Prolixibacteraceae bacterium]|nr:T9SS type A sorting domain-containing protein [Prolixibacteraceae bacterium]